MTGPAELLGVTQRRRAQGVLLVGGTFALLAGSAMATFSVIVHVYDNYDSCRSPLSNVRPIVVSLVCVAALLLGAAIWLVWFRSDRCPRRYVTVATVLLGIVSPLFVIAWLIIVTMQPMTERC